MINVCRLYVGLSREDKSEPIDSDQVVSWLSEHLESFTVTAATGFFRGTQEETLVVMIANDNRQFVIDLAYRLRAHLEQDGIGLEIAGEYQRITAENDPLMQQWADEPAIYPNFNVRVYSGLRKCRDWCRVQNIWVRVFENFDGGGFNFYIFEFKSLERARGFAAHFDINGERSIWIEKEGKNIHYLNETLEVTADNDIKEEDMHIANSRYGMAFAGCSGETRESK